MKRFVLTRTAPDPRFDPECFGHQWRATWAARGSDITVDIFFYAKDVAEAKKHVRKRYPDATFSDEKQDPVQVTVTILRGAAELVAFILFFAAISVWWILT